MGEPAVRFERLELLGEGSLGRVYRARDRETGEQVAPDSPSCMARPRARSA